MVAKRFNRQNLFQVACFDLRERFHYLVLLSFVCVRNLNELDWDLGIACCTRTVECSGLVRYLCLLYPCTLLRFLCDLRRYEYVHVQHQYDIEQNR